MLAISDGGSTKADWKILTDGGEIIRTTTTGFNPNYSTQSEITQLLQAELLPVLGGQSSGAIHYYGAGCWDEARKGKISNAFLEVFPSLDIHVFHDLLAAARATCGTTPGIACILGTGSNTVLYDGEKEVDNVINLGFMIGDEGSGAVIGKELVKAFFYREMPSELNHIMEKLCPGGKKDILDKVYSGGVPAAYLASFTKHFSAHKDHPFVCELIKNCFDEFLQRHVFKYAGYQKLPIHFIGSIAYHFRDILESLLSDYKLTKGVILQKPIDNLFKFHLEYFERETV